jgi:adenosylcobinamide-phosphate synthase
MSPALEATLVFAAAWLLDCTVGEPPAALHPVLWMGRAIAPLKRLRARGPTLELLIGALYTAFVACAFTAAGLLARRQLSGWPLARFVFDVYVLLSCFALKGLLDAGSFMRAALAADDLTAARRGLACLCSRDASQLNETELAGATVESITENTSDSVVAPLFYFALFGIAGALFYRTVNTLDAMVGYRGRYEYLGKAAARLDDLLNFVPARITALLLWCAGGLLGLSLAAGSAIWRRDRHRTESPNAGQVMAMASGLLGVRLDKRGAYVLGAELASPDQAALARGLHLVRLAGWLCAALLIATLLVVGGPYGVFIR